MVAPHACHYCKKPIIGLVIPEGVELHGGFEHPQCSADFNQHISALCEEQEAARAERRAEREKELSLTAPHCNLCGEACCIVGAVEDQSAGLINASASGGFDSTPGNGQGALDDGTAYSFNLCEFCLDWLFTHFKIPPSLWDYMSDRALEEIWRSAEQRCLEDEWRKSPERFRAEAARRANLRKKADP